MRRAWPHHALLACAAMLVACTSAPTGPAPSAAPVPRASVAPAPIAESTKTYRIDPTVSTLHILVYRGGPMARLGHNHVVSSQNLRGTVWQGAALGDASFDIIVPVNDLVVDDNAARAAEGEDFPLNVSEDAKQGTKANMLRDTLLDGARYPEIHITSLRIEGDARTPTVTAALRIRDHMRQVSVPVALTTTDTGLHIAGRFDIKQSDFGITPLSIAMGALLVVDTVKIKFALVAVAN